MTTNISDRVLAPITFSRYRAFHLLERNALVAKRYWVGVVSGFSEPIFYLFAIGVGIGEIIGNVTGPNGVSVEYAAFVAPALLGASAMNVAVFESTVAVYLKLTYTKTYDAVVTTPMQPRDIAVGEIAWSLIRSGIYTTSFLLIMWLFGFMPSQWGWLAVPTALLIGFAFSAVGVAASTFLKSWQDFDMILLVTLPLFLFSATFYPLSVYPGWLQAVARVSPLYHGVELIRSLTLGIFDLSFVGHAIFLVAMGLIGALISARRMKKLLLG